MSSPTDSDDTCPGCGATNGVQSQPAPPTVAAWTCRACGLDWAVTVVNPFLDRLTTTVAMRQVIALADEQLRDQLLTLAGRARGR